jgi:hypothetical protein
VSARVRDALLAAALLAAAPSCAPPPADFARALSTEPVEPRAFKTALARWSRHAHITHDWDTALDADVVLFVPEMRVAYAAKVSTARRLPAAEREAAIATARLALTDRIDAWVFLQTSRWEWNDLASLQSMWTISLVEGERGVTAIHREGLAEKEDALAALFPWVTPFTKSWRVTFPGVFPDGTPILRPDTQSLTIRFAGPLGSADARWDAPAPAR